LNTEITLKNVLIAIDYARFNILQSWIVVSWTSLFEKLLVHSNKNLYTVIYNIYLKTKFSSTLFYLKLNEICWQIY